MNNDNNSLYKDKQIWHPSNFVDLTNQIFNDLLVIEWDIDPPETEFVKNGAKGLWRCQCLRCGKPAWANTDQLKSGKRKACRECGYKAKTARKYKIEYDLSGEYGIGYTYNTGIPFYFDLEDYDLIKNLSWKENNNGYIVACINNTEISMHRLVMQVTDSNLVVDHIKHQLNDNRKKLLRIATTHQNTMNEKLAKNNKSGKTGVCFENNKWRAYIWYNGENIHLGSYKEKEDAINARLEAEDKYFKDFSYHNSLLIGDLNER